MPKEELTEFQKMRLSMKNKAADKKSASVRTVRERPVTPPPPVESPGDGIMPNFSGLAAYDDNESGARTPPLDAQQDEAPDLVRRFFLPVWRGFIIPLANQKACFGCFGCGVGPRAVAVVSVFVANVSLDVRLSHR